MRFAIAIIIGALLLPLARADGDETDLRLRVDAAIERGKKALLARLDGVVRNPAGDFPAGRIGIVVAALLKSGVPPENAQLQAALAKLEALKIEKTYCAACSLFALGGFARAKGGTLDATSRRKLAALVEWLTGARVKGHGSWTYEPAQKQDRHDFSNTQFAVLGLRVGLENGIPVPREAFQETAKLFVGAITRESSEADFEYTLDTPLEARLKLTRVSPVRRCRVAPGGWGYTDPRKGKGKLDDPYASMTAAGASSLAIALEALRTGKGASKDDAKLIADCEKALQSAFAWIAKHFDLFVADGKQLFYTLYSLEKAGDVCGVEKFGDHAWYVEGAARILEKQRADGGWGSYVDTSLALLFLTRATRSLEASAAPTVFTGSARDKPATSAADSDLVYIESVKGFLSAKALLKYLGESRKPELTAVGEEVLRNYAPDSRETLVPCLLELWEKPDKVTSFAQKALAEVTGVKLPRKELYESWQVELDAIRALESRATLEPEEVARKLKEVESPRLKARLARLAQRRSFVDLAGTLVGELSTSSAEYRRSLHGILSLWLGNEVTPPSADTDAAWEANARAWQDWWRAHGGEWEEKRKK